jgi:hypothetical protein
MYKAQTTVDQTARQIRDSMDHHIRRYHGYSIQGKINGHYRQIGVDESNCVFEHVIPATNVLAMLIEGHLTITQALNTPTCLIKKEDDVILRKSGLGSSSPDNWNFFKRYSVLDSKFRTYNGHMIENLDNFTHWVRIFANYILTKINNIINNQNLSDAHTCYKVFDSKIFKKIKLVENDFAFCPEATTKISNLGYKIYEVPISYKGRAYSEGKKITFKDGIKAIFTIIKYKFFLN